MRLTEPHSLYQNIVLLKQQCVDINSWSLSKWLPLSNTGISTTQSLPTWAKVHSCHIPSEDVQVSKTHQEKHI